MVRVIKSPKTANTSSTTPTMPLGKLSGNRIIDKEVYEAQKQAERILKEGEQEKRHKLALGREFIQKTKEEAVSKAAKDAFAKVGLRLLDVFLKRAKNCESQKGWIKAISSQVASHIIGPKIAPDVGDELVEKAIHAMRSRRILYIFLPAGKKVDLNTPELVFQEDPQLDPGWVRLSYDIGQVVCEAQPILDFLENYGKNIFLK